MTRKLEGVNHFHYYLCRQLKGGGMENFMRKDQMDFFKELTYIQEYCINVTLSKEEKYCNTEELLKDVTCEVIYRVMELLDGYGGKLQRCKIVNTITAEVINEGVELHDKCVEFLDNPFNRVS